MTFEEALEAEQDPLIVIGWVDQEGGDPPKLRQLIRHDDRRYVVVKELTKEQFLAAVKRNKEIRARTGRGSASMAYGDHTGGSPHLTSFPESPDEPPDVFTHYFWVLELP